MIHIPSIRRALKFTTQLFVAALLSTLIGCGDQNATLSESLPSWQDTPNSQRLHSFIKDVSDEGSANFVAPDDRIAVFDNDGTLWAEQPAYFQLFFAMDRVRAMADADPELKKEWLQQQPFKSVLESDMKSLVATGEAGLIKLVMASHTGHDAVTTVEFETRVKEWIATATHPDTGRLYTDMVYQPMLELLDHLRANDFRVYIVSGGGMDFVRPWAERVYGIPKENVIGSRVAIEYEYRNGEPVLLRRPKIGFIDDKAGKPVAIHQFIGKRPILAFGNSDGDLQMLQWTDANDKPHLSAYIHHTDAEREWAYDSNSHIGQLKQGLKQASQKDWLVVDMKQDWKQVFPK